MEKIIYPPWISKKMKVRFDNLLLCIDASGFIHSCRSYDKEWDFQTCAMWLRINGMGPDEICRMLNVKLTTVKNYWLINIIKDYKEKNYKLCGTVVSLKTKLKYKKLYDNPEYIELCRLNGKRLASDPEWIKNQKAGVQKLLQNPKYIENRRLLGERLSNDPNFGKRISAGYQHIPYDGWESFASDSSYCPAFNEKCREANRKKYNRRCFICNLLESENITSTGKLQRLSVHHVDMDKGQGCDGKKWKLVPICLDWHGKVHTKVWEYRIIWLLDNVWCSDEYMW